MIRKTLKRPLSLLMAVTMLFSNIAGTGLVLAEDAETEFASSGYEETNDSEITETEAQITPETESAAIEEVVITPVLHNLVLPYYEGCEYGYDSSHKTGIDGKDIVLGYYADEEVKLSVVPFENYDITEFHVYNPQKVDIPHSWTEDTGKLSFTMPDEDLKLDISLVEMIMETEAVHYEDPVMEVPIENTQELVSESGNSEESVQEETSAMESESYEIVTEADGFPAQGSIYQVDTLTISYDCWDFDPKTNFTGIGYDENEFTISYLSDDVDFVTPGVYSTIYRAQQKNTERMWYVLRPVKVSEPNQFEEPVTEESTDAEVPAAGSAEETEADDEDPDPVEETEVVTEQETESITEAVTEEVVVEETDIAEETEVVSEAVTESFVEIETEVAITENATEEEQAVEVVEDENAPAPDYSELVEVSDDEMYYLTLPEIGSTETLKKVSLWKDDTAIGIEDYVPESSTLAKADVEWFKGNVDISKCGEYELVFTARLMEDPDYYWYVCAPFEVVEDKNEADILSDDSVDAFYLRDLGDDKHTGVIPEKIGDVVEGENITVIRGEEFNLLDVNFDYDWDVFGLDLMDDGGFDYNTAGVYHVIYEIFAWQDLTQTFLVKCNVTVEDMEENKGSTLIHIASGELVADVVPANGEKQTAKYGEDVLVNGNIKTILVRSAYGHDIEPEIHIYKDGFPVEDSDLIKKENEGDNTLKLTLKTAEDDSYYQVDIDAPAYCDDGKVDKRSSEWVDVEDEDYVPEEKNDGFSSFFSGLLAASPFVMTVEAADASKKWTGKSTIVKSLQTYGADSGYSEVGAKSKAHVYLKDSIRTSIKTWIVDTQGLDLEGKIPTVIDVKCCSPGLWGWYTSGALSQCCSGVSLTATVEKNSKGEPVNVKLYLKCTGASGFQSFSGTVRIPVSEGGGSLQLTKKSTSDNIIKTFSNIKVDTTFIVYSNEACTKEVADIDIDPLSETGNSVTATIELDEGTYWVVETHRITGHVWNTNKYKIVINNGETTKLTVVNQPFYFKDFFLVKKGSNNNLPLAGAVYKVSGTAYNVNLGTWYFKTDANGKVAYDAAHYLASWNGKNSSALFKIDDTVGYALPSGTTLTVQEVEAPAGYLLDSKTYTVNVGKTQDGTAYKNPVLTCTPLSLTDEKDEGYLKLVKQDRELGSKVPNKEYYSLEGAVYTVYSGTKSVATLTTKADGTTDVVALPTGKYTVKETTAPEGYELSTETFDVTLTTANTMAKAYTVTAKEDAENGKLKIHKIAEEAEPGAIWAKRDLSKVTFKLTYKADPTITRTVHVDKNGYGTAEGLFFGEWTIEETVPPLYHAAMEAEVITIEDTSTLEAEIENYRYEAELVIEKRDAESGNLVKRAGAQFEITDEAGNTVSLKQKGASEAGTVFTTDADGKVLFDEKIPAGKYTLKETKAPLGYMPGEPVAFVVPDNKAVTVVMNDIRMKHDPVSVKKTDSETGNTAGEGFEFTLYAYEDILDGSGSVYAGWNKDAVIEKAVTGSNGIAEFKKNLYPGQYVIRETKAAAGYMLNTTQEIVFEVTETEEGCGMNVISGNEEFTFTDQPVMRPILVIKKDAVTGNPAGAGFTFTITAENVVDGSGKVRAGFEKGTVIDTITTDGSSTALSKDLYIGTYTVKETGRAENYLLAEQVFTVEVKDEAGTSEPVEFTVKDEPFKKKIQVTKIDEKTGNRCGAGFVFSIYAAEDIMDGSKAVYSGYEKDALVGTMTTGEDGIAVSKDLYLGNYYIVETEVPESGYAINGERYEVSLTDEKAVDGSLAASEDQMLVIPVEDVKDHPTTLILTKVSALNGKILPGCIFRVKEKNAEDNDDQLYTVGEDGKLVAEYLKKNRTYTVSEVSAVPGYNVNPEVTEITVDEKGLIEGLATKEITFENEPNRVPISKRDITTSDEVPGASLKVTDSEGNVVDEWVSEDTPHFIYELPAGTYTLTEVLAPEKYEEAESIEFTVIDTVEIQSVVMNDSPFRRVDISKKDITNEEEIPGCTLTIKDADGEVVDTWVSEETPHRVELHSGTYTLIEEQPAEKYEEAEEVTFEVIRTTAEDYEIQTVVMHDSPFRKVEVSKTDITGEKEIPGCTLTIKNAEGEVVETWVSEEEPHKVELHSGSYTLVEERPAPGYVTAEEVAFEVIQTTAEDFEVTHVEMKDDVTKVQISKKDITTGEELPGATITITDEEGNVVEEWVSEEEPHYIEMLPIGTYTLTETIAPDYYSKAEAITFEVSDTGEIQTVEMFDKKIEVSISKRDITNEKELPGAKLEVKDEQGNVIETWVSTEEEHLINLKTGKYTLTEITAPEGYEVAETISFEVTDDLEVQHVTMYDSPKEKFVDLTGKKREYKTDGTPGTPGTNTVTPPVKTGDQFRYLAALILVAIAVISGSGLFVTRKKRGKKDR